MVSSHSCVNLVATHSHSPVSLTTTLTMITHLSRFTALSTMTTHLSTLLPHSPLTPQFACTITTHALCSLIPVSHSHHPSHARLYHSPYYISFTVVCISSSLKGENNFPSLCHFPLFFSLLLFFSFPFRKDDKWHHVLTSLGIINLDLWGHLLASSIRHCHSLTCCFMPATRHRSVFRDAYFGDDYNHDTE